MLETIKTIATKSYNENEPTNGVLIKDIPEAIREKGKTIIDYIGELEEARTSRDISSAVKEFPNLKAVYIDGSSNLPSGMYIKQNEVWLGYENYDRIPFNIDSYELNERITIDNKTFEMFNDSNIKIMTESNSTLPQTVFDFFELPKEVIQERLKNRGLYSRNKILLEVKNASRYDNMNYPYIVTKNNSILTTQNSESSKLPFENRLTVSCTFNKISRKYQDGSNTVINNTDFASLIRIFDESNTFNIALVYDDSLRLALDLNGVRKLTDFQFDENNFYQWSLKILNGKVYVMVNSRIVTQEDIIGLDLTNLSTYISYATGFSNSLVSTDSVTGAVILSDPVIFREALTVEENNSLKNFPRSYSINYKKESYITLSIEEQKLLKDQLSKQVTTL